MELHARLRVSVGLVLLVMCLVGTGTDQVSADPIVGPQTPPDNRVWAWPVPRPTVIEAFNGPPSPWSPGHRGVDLAALAGDQITSVGPGTVAFVGQVAGIPVIAIDHPGTGLRSTYQPVWPSVSVGQRVAAGEVIGHLAAIASHCSGPCLHLGVKRPGAGVGGKPIYVDPLRLLARPAVLKPIRGPRHGDAPG